MRPFSYLVVLTAFLAGCASKNTAPNTDTSSRIGDAVTAPLSDLNLVRTKIPDILNEAKKNPYRHPADMSCEKIGSEVTALDETLGPDLDAPKPSSESGMMEKGTTMAGDSAIDALRGTTEGLIPFRGWVRKLTGAERHSKEVASAIAAGIVRRAYLKGIGQSHGCETPAAPLPTLSEKPGQP